MTSEAARVRTRTRVVDPVRPDPAAVADAASVLRAGGLVAFPTETVYGLGARVLDEAALARVFAAKGRPTTHALIAHVAGEAGARALASTWSEQASRLARAFWPGPLTLVVPRAEGVPALVAGGGDSIAVRAPSHPFARALLAALGEPIAAPSANRYQSLSPTTAAHVLDALDGLVDLVIDGGPSLAGIESTVVDVRGGEARVLRPGAIDLPTLRAVEPGVLFVALTAGPAAAHPSPGMDARHYAPRAALLLVRGRAEALARGRALATAGPVGAILRGKGGNDPILVVRTLADDPARYAHDLYATLHELDGLGVRTIVVEDVPRDDERWTAIADRLCRAATDEGRGSWP